MSYLAKYEAKRLVEKMNNQMPVDLYKLCEMLDIEVAELDCLDDEVRGQALLSMDKHKKICISTNKGPYNFTMAHEIGHHVLNHLKPGDCLNDVGLVCNDNDTYEKEANEFARHLLAPQHMVKRFIAELGISKIGELARVFNIPYEEMRTQVEEIHIRNNPMLRRLVKVRKHI